MPENLTNKSFNLDALLYIMAGAGSEIAGPGTFAAGAGPPTQQLLRAKGYREMVKELLGTEEGKFSTDGKSFSLKAPMSSLQDADRFIGDPTGGAATPAPTPTQAPSPTGGGDPEAMRRLMMMSGLFNPSASPLDISSASLAGLTVEDITSALKMKFGMEELKRKKIADVSEAAYRGTLMRKMEVGMAATQEKLRPFIGNLTIDQFKTLTTSDKEYTLAKERAKKLGDTEFMPKREWEETEPTERRRFLGELLDMPELLDVERELAKVKRIASAPGPTPVNWTTATKELTKRFGKLDPTGMWAVTPELQTAHRKAQTLLVDFKDAGVDPLRAVNKSETEARKWKDAIERNYFAKIAEAQKIKNRDDRERRMEWIRGEFRRQYKYIPSAGDY